MQQDAFVPPPGVKSLNRQLLVMAVIDHHIICTRKQPNVLDEIKTHVCMKLGNPFVALEGRFRGSIASVHKEAF